MGQESRGSAIDAIHAEHRKRWPGIEFVGVNRNAAWEGVGDEPVEVTLTWDQTPDCRFRLLVTAQRQLTAITIESTVELTARMLARVPFGMLRDAAADLVRRTMAATGEDHRDRSHVNQRMKYAWARVFERQPRPGRAGRDSLFYAQLAEAYVACLIEPTPLKELKRRLDRRRTPAADHLSESQLRSLLYEARRRGMLTDAPPGRAGGELTETATRLLRGEDLNAAH